MSTQRLSVIIVMAALLAGCGKEGRTVKYAELADADVIVRAGNAQLTKARLERDVKFRVCLEAGRSQRFSAAQAAKLEAQLYAGAVDHFLTQQAYAAAVRELGVILTEDEYRKTCENFARRQTRGRQKWQAYVRSLSDNVSELLKQELTFEGLRMKTDATLMEKYTQPVSSNDIAAVRVKARAYNERSRQIERDTYQKATNIWRQIVADGPKGFDLALERYAEGDKHIITDPRWEGLDAESFRGETALASIVPAMKVGDITPPVEGDNGLVILQLTARQNVPKEPGSMLRNYQYSFKKIFFELPEYVSETESDAKIAKDLSFRNARDAVKARMAGYRAALQVSYPNGKVKFK